jgi:hypothetical protein
MLSVELEVKVKDFNSFLKNIKHKSFNHGGIDLILRIVCSHFSQLSSFHFSQLISLSDDDSDEIIER